MLTLNAARSGEGDLAWLELGEGVRVQVKPCTSSIYRAAMAWGRRQVLDAYPPDEGEDGGEGGGAAAVAIDEDERAGLAADLVVRGLGRFGVVDWEGVGVTEDEAVAFSRENLDALFSEYWTLGDEFLRKYLEPMEAVESEKNGSAPEANGDTVSGVTTANPAETSTPPAPEESQLKTEASAP